jgi:hypothetical protein
VTLLADVATNYVQYRVAQQRTKIARANVRTQEQIVALAERREKVGTITTLDVEQGRLAGASKTQPRPPGIALAVPMPGRRGALRGPAALRRL